MELCCLSLMLPRHKCDLTAVALLGVDPKKYHKLGVIYHHKADVRDSINRATVVQWA